jgi:DNA-binding transcriptional MerR regulator
MPDKHWFLIGELAQILGERRCVIDYWVKQFHIRPERSGCGYRVFSRVHLAKLIAIRALLRDEGYTIRGASMQLERVRKAMAARPESEVANG